MEKPKQYRLLEDYEFNGYIIKTGTVTLPKLSTHQCYKIPLELGGVIIFPIKKVEDNNKLFELVELKDYERERIPYLTNHKFSFKEWWKQLWCKHISFSVHISSGKSNSYSTVHKCRECNKVIPIK